MAKRTLEEWRRFMNGYRDPLTRAEDRAEAAAFKAEFGDFDSRYGEDRYSGGGMNGGDGGERECGHRKEGGTYAVVGTSPYGKPVEDFLLCKPMPIDKDEYSLTNIGVKLVDIPEDCLTCGGVPSKGRKTCPGCDGTGKVTVTHVFDIIGQDNYPNIADFLEEARRMGISRRLELEDARQYARLSKRSKLFFLHHKAVIQKPFELYLYMEDMEKERLMRAGCPKSLPVHLLTVKDDKILPGGTHFAAPGCSSLYWNVLEGGESVPEDKAEEILAAEVIGDAPGRYVKRKLKSGSYFGYALPEQAKPQFSLGVFAVFPLSRIEVIDPDGSYEDEVERASHARLDVEAVEC